MPESLEAARTVPTNAVVAPVTADAVLALLRRTLDAAADTTNRYERLQLELWATILAELHTIRGALASLPKEPR